MGIHVHHLEDTLIGFAIDPIEQPRVAIPVPVVALERLAR